MKKPIFSVYFIAMILFGVIINVPYAEEVLKYDGIYGNGDLAITLATGSPGSLGLLKALSEPFCRRNNCTVRWIKMGSGASLKALKEAKVDMILVHSPEAEKNALEEGWASMRTLIGGNEFFIVGPPSDPASIKNLNSVIDAYMKIASSESMFFSRGDNSGTHKKEMMIWERAEYKPKGEWYIITKDFMGPTLIRADLEGGYFMTDSSTYYSKRSKIKNLHVLFKGDPLLINLYHALSISPDRISKDKYKLVTDFIKFISSEEGQIIIGEYGKKEYGLSIYMTSEQVNRFKKH